MEVTKGAGVAKVDKVDNENKIVYLTLARHTGDGTPYSATPAKWEEDGVQDDLNAVINIKGLEGATINGTTATSLTLNDADNGKTFQVTSASKGNTSTFTIVAKYEDALESFSVDGAEGLITDENKDRCSRHHHRHPAQGRYPGQVGPCSDRSQLCCGVRRPGR